MNYELEKKNVLSIDTAGSKEAYVCLTIGKKAYKKTGVYDRNKAQIVLPMVQQLLREHDLDLTDITAIEVNPGPGSFTGLRVGVAVANALGHSLNIPINNLPIGRLVEPIYT